ncbi:MAG TPA: aldo/keto reductase [Enorma massiliensis]|uniref:aldo/keto reductase n=1 Tax=Enorma massiliensis TaxID=1472761 RepID=UPI001DECE16C|nr:aldo/keto reductase [Enorma massiliensis]HJG62559.1 aldo/keto reductase [Enorma massiliensis]
MEYLKLNNDVKMPVEGLGTFLMSPAEAEAASLAALEAGYEHIDTANAYMNEKAVGRAIAKSGVARDKLFVSTKLWPSVYEAGDAAIEGTLNRLGLDYVDMLILHQPVGNYLAAWKTMEKAYMEGKVRALGLSNFPQEKIAEVIDHAEIKPQLVTVECHPYFAQSDLREYLSQYGIVIEAWYPLGHGDKGLQEEPVFTKLAEKYGKTAAQVILRWHVQMGTSIIPGSKNPAHIADNADIFDFELTDEEMAEIAKLDGTKKYYEATEEALAGYLAIKPDFDAQE